MDAARCRISLRVLRQPPALLLVLALLAQCCHPTVGLSEQPALGEHGAAAAVPWGATGQQQQQQQGARDPPPEAERNASSGPWWQGNEGLWVGEELWDEHMRVGAGRGYLVVPVLSAGLGNRLRLMASALQLAQDSGRVCVLVWYRSASCNASFSDLFLPFDHNDKHQEADRRPPWWGLVVLEGEEAEQRSGLVAALTRLALDTSSSWLRYDGGSGGGLLDVPALPLDRNLVPASRLLLDPSYPIVLLRVKTGLWFNQAPQPCSDYYQRKSRFYQSLVPVPAVSSVLESLSARHGLLREEEGVVGVHVRAIALQHDTPEVEAAGGGRYYWNQSAPASLFLDLMHAMTTLLHHQQQQAKPSLRFLVVSNDPSVGPALQRDLMAATEQQQQPVTVLTVDGMLEGEEEGSAAAGLREGSSGDRESVAGMQRALLDLLLLSRCWVVVHPFASSFGEEAAAMHLRPSLQLLFHHLLHGVDPGSASRSCHSLRLLTEARMLANPSLSEDQARALDLEPCPPPSTTWPFSGLQVLCLPEQQHEDHHRPQAVA